MTNELIRFKLSSAHASATSPVSRQRGAALFISLMFLILLTLIGLSAANVGILQERMAGNVRESNIAFQTAEAALRGIEIPVDQVPLAIDEFPALFIAAACAEGETLLTGAAELRVKESDRIAVMAEGLSTLGVRAEALSDGIRIYGRGREAGTVFGGGQVQSYDDHRIAMSFAMAALRSAAPIEVRDCANVNTSFPGFATLAAGAGLVISEQAA